ncbi:hypothetical protein DM01DRAFT_1332697 [Hesseltinella vesiculosa]|uniref:Uncharacterized protein n=1 Tax=Hesseltinella vesiculosa TaxID=101127 RepID=A0A1X2GSS3_9FUNG|nr:hypothetical protein DM01DRAFT_1332697 [Hesseltinella vesiculosa]
MILCRQFVGGHLRIFAQVQGIDHEFKKNGLEIIGYARKSPSNSDSTTRLRLSQKMINNLRDRSLEDKIYVSTSSHASSPFNERDSNEINEVMQKLEGVTGNKYPRQKVHNMQNHH